MQFFLVILVVVVGSMGISILTKAHLSSVVPFCVFGIVVFLYFFGIFEALKIGVYALYGTIFLTCVFALVRVLRRQSEFHISSVIEPWIVVFCFLSFVSYLSVRNTQFSQWDEFSHWGLVAKAMHEHDALAPFNSANILFRSYPPGMSLWQYFVGGVGSEPFSEGKAIWAVRLFEFALLTPFMRFLKWREPVEIVIVSSVFLLIPFLFPNSGSVYVDFPLGLCFGFLLSWVFMKVEFRVFDLLPIGLGMAMIILMKDSGRFLAFLVACFVFSRICFSILHKNYFNRFFSAIKFLSPLLIFSWLVSASWRYVVNSQHVQQVFSEKIRIGSLTCIVDQSCPLHWEKVASNFLSAFMRTPIASGFIGKSALVFTMVLVVFLVLIFALESQFKSQPKELKDIFSPLVLMFSLLSYVLGLFLLYLFRFGEYEAVSLASFSRYLSTFFVGLTFFVTVVMTNSILGVRAFHSNVRRGGVNHPVTLKFVAAIWIAIVYLSATVVHAGSPVTTLYNYDYSTAVVREEIKSIASGLIKNGAVAGDKVWFINQYSKGFEYYVMKYELLDIDFADSWSIGVPSGESDVWTNNEVTSGYWDSELQNYQFVALMNFDASFIDQYFELFGGKDLVKQFTIYKVNFGNGSPRLTSVE